MRIAPYLFYTGIHGELHSIFTQHEALCNLVAAILCTTGTGLEFLASILCITFLSVLGVAIATIGGMFWLLAALAAIFW
jgi:hypothetical protein